MNNPGNITHVLLSIGVMSLTTYLVRMLPMAIFRKKITNPFLKSFLYYVPYAVLAAMTIPAIFTSTSGVVSAAVGFAAAVVASYFGMNLMPVALIACAAVFVADCILKII